MPGTDNGESVAQHGANVLLLRSAILLARRQICYDSESELSSLSRPRQMGITGKIRLQLLMQGQYCPNQFGTYGAKYATHAKYCSRRQGFLLHLAVSWSTSSPHTLPLERPLVCPHSI